MAKEWKHRYQKEQRTDAFKEFLSWGNNDLIEHILELRSVIDKMNEELDGGAQKNNNPSKKTFVETDFKQTWSYPTKIAFLLTLNQKPLTSEELHHLLLKLDKHYKDYDAPRNNLTVTLSRAVKSGRIKKEKVPGIKNLYYVLPEWVDKEGKLIIQYQIKSPYF